METPKNMNSIPNSDNDNKLDESVEELELSIQKFWNYLNIKNDPKKSDAIFILGGSSLEPVQKAIQLYREGFAPKIGFISTGGKFGGEKIWGMSEHEKYKEVLIEAGVPEKDIVTEGLTTNTLEEAKKSIPFLKEHGIDPRTLILISRPIHQMRAYLTFQKQNPGIEYINCPADEGLDISDEETRVRLVQEAERLLDYGVKKDDIEKPEISREILEAAVTIRKNLKETGVYEARTKPKIIN